MVYANIWDKGLAKKAKYFQEFLHSQEGRDCSRNHLGTGKYHLKRRCRKTTVRLLNQHKQTRRGKKATNNWKIALIAKLSNYCNLTDCTHWCSIDLLSASGKTWLEDIFIAGEIRDIQAAKRKAKRFQRRILHPSSLTLSTLKKPLIVSTKLPPEDKG